MGTFLCYFCLQKKVTVTVAHVDMAENVSTYKSPLNVLAKTAGKVTFVITVNIPFFVCSFCYAVSKSQASD
jgi:hypothetical protein